MIYGVYSVRDVKSGFLFPTVDVNDQVAIRDFVNSIASTEFVVSSYAKDLALYHIADFDSDTGRITSLDLPVHLFEAFDALLVASRSSGGDV